MSDEQVTLRDYVERQFALRDRADAILAEANALALTLATTQLDGRLEKLNRLRENVLTKDAFETFEKETDRRIRALENWQAKLIGIGIVLVLVAGIAGAGIMRLVSR